jgi:hypothetical protein
VLLEVFKAKTVIMFCKVQSSHFYETSLIVMNRSNHYSMAALNAGATSDDHHSSALSQFMGTLTINHQSCILVVDNPGAVSFQEKTSQQHRPGKDDQDKGVHKIASD